MKAPTAPAKINTSNSSITTPNNQSSYYTTAKVPTLRLVIIRLLHMPRDDARNYAQRLHAALKRSPKPISTAAELAREFSLRHEHEPITPQAAQKWLMGKARPRFEKSVTLATWLGVSPEWLHYGEAGIPAQDDRLEVETDIQLSAPEALLITRLRQLSRHQQELAAAVVEEFASVNRLFGQPQHDERHEG